MISIDKNVRIPRATAEVEHDRAVQKACRDYRRAYEAVYVRSPELTVKESGYISIDGKDGVSVRRLKQLTAQLINRKELQA